MTSLGGPHGENGSDGDNAVAKSNDRTRRHNQEFLAQTRVKNQIATDVGNPTPTVSKKLG